MTKGDKIRRVLDTRDLDLTGEELENRWLNGGDEDSLRNLAFEYNCQVLDSELRENGHMLDPETVKTKTKNLQNKDAPATKIDLRKRGVDVESVLVDLVTYQTMYSYLTIIRGVEYESRSRNKHNVVTVLSGACTRLEAIAQQELDNRDLLAEGDLTAKVECQVSCPSCGTWSSARYWLVKGHCKECGPSDQYSIDAAMANSGRND